MIDSATYRAVVLAAQEAQQLINEATRDVFGSVVATDGIDSLPYEEAERVTRMTYAVTLEQVVRQLRAMEEDDDRATGA